MNREKARKFLGIGLTKEQQEQITEEQVTNFLNEWHKEKEEEKKVFESEINDLKSQMNKYNDYDDIKKQLDDINKAKMTEQEKMELMQKETKQKLADANRIYNTAKAKEILAGLDLDEDLIQLVVSEDAEKTIASANKLKEKFDIQKENVVKETKESLTSLNLDPTLPNVNQNTNVIDTFEKFGKLSATEQEKWLNENPNGLENLI